MNSLQVDSRVEPVHDNDLIFFEKVLFQLVGKALKYRIIIWMLWDFTGI